jgi:hypothetical protein
VVVGGRLWLPRWVGPESADCYQDKRTRSPISGAFVRLLVVRLLASKGGLAGTAGEGWGLQLVGGWRGGIQSSGVEGQAGAGAYIVGTSNARYASSEGVHTCVGPRTVVTI